MSKSKHRVKKLTLKAAKAIIMQELGKSTGLIPHENNSAYYKRYEIRFGSYTATISSANKYPGFAVFSLAGVYKFYNIATLQEDYGITDMERRKSQREDIREMVACDHNFLIKALVDEHGLESCHRMLDAAL